MTAVETLRCPFRFSLPNTAHHYCIDSACHAFEELSKITNTCHTIHPYCHALKRFLRVKP